jgi:hypothetical protein
MEEEAELMFEMPKPEMKIGRRVAVQRARTGTARPMP